jgi:hypothetical protein
MPADLLVLPREIGKARDDVDENAEGRHREPSERYQVNPRDHLPVERLCHPPCGD